MKTPMVVQSYHYNTSALYNQEKIWQFPVV